MGKGFGFFPMCSTEIVFDPTDKPMSFGRLDIWLAPIVTRITDIKCFSHNTSASFQVELFWEHSSRIPSVYLFFALSSYNAFLDHIFQWIHILPLGSKKSSCGHSVQSNTVLQSSCVCAVSSIRSSCELLAVKFFPWLDFLL